MDVYARIGVRPIVNARGMNTMASGSLMPKPVLDAMTEAATAFVDMGELNVRAGAHIARLTGVEGAHVTSGSAGGLLLAAAACIAGEDPERIARLPRGVEQLPAVPQMLEVFGRAAVVDARLRVLIGDDFGNLDNGAGKVPVAHPAVAIDRHVAGHRRPRLALAQRADLG